MITSLRFKPDVRRYLTSLGAHRTLRELNDLLGKPNDDERVKRHEYRVEAERQNLVATYGQEMLDAFDAVLAEVDAQMLAMDTLGHDLSAGSLTDSSIRDELVVSGMRRDGLDDMLFSWDADAHPMFVLDAEDQQDYDFARDEIVERYGEPLAKIIDEVWNHPSRPQCATGYLVDLVQVVAERRGAI